MTVLSIVDTETNALGDLAVPYEIAVIQRNLDDPEAVDAECVWHITYTPNNLPAGTNPESLAVGGWGVRVWGAAGEEYRAMLDRQDVLVAAGPEWTIARSVQRLLRDTILVAAGPFDLPVLRRMFLRHGLIRPDQDVWHYSTHDLKSQAYGYALAKGYRPALPMNSRELSDLLGVAPAPVEERHTALGDARWALRMWETMYSRDTPALDLPLMDRYSPQQLPLRDDDPAI